MIDSVNDSHTVFLDDRIRRKEQKTLQELRGCRLGVRAAGERWRGAGEAGQQAAAPDGDFSRLGLMLSRLGSC